MPGGFCVSDDTTTQCLLFPDIFPKPVVAQFDQQDGSSDGGAVPGGRSVRPQRRRGAGVAAVGLETTRGPPRLLLFFLLGAVTLLAIDALFAPWSFFFVSNAKRPA
jgi:hypothetical protein